MSSEDDVMSIEEAAKDAGVDPRTIYRWIRDGHLHAEKQPVEVVVVKTFNKTVVLIKDLFACRNREKHAGGRPPGSKS